MALKLVGGQSGQISGMPSGTKAVAWNQTPPPSLPATQVVVQEFLPTLQKLAEEFASLHDSPEEAALWQQAEETEVKLAVFNDKREAVSNAMWDIVGPMSYLRGLLALEVPGGGVSYPTEDY